MSEPVEHKQIWLAPICHEDGDGRQWCQDDVWGDDCGCDIAEHQSVRYVLASDYDRLEQECAIHKNTAKGANNQLNANRLETEKLAKDWLSAAEERDAALRQVDGLREALAKAAKGVHWLQAHVPMKKDAQRHAYETRAAIEAALEANT